MYPVSVDSLLVYDWSNIEQETKGVVGVGSADTWLSYQLGEPYLSLASCRFLSFFYFHPSTLFSFEWPLQVIADSLIAHLMPMYCVSSRGGQVVSRSMKYYVLHSNLWLLFLSPFSPHLPLPFISVNRRPDFVDKKVSWHTFLLPCSRSFSFPMGPINLRLLDLASTWKKEPQDTHPFKNLFLSESVSQWKHNFTLNAHEDDTRVFNFPEQGDNFVVLALRRFFAFICTFSWSNTTE